MTDTVLVTAPATAPAPAPPAKRRRGRETAVDMVRSLAVVFLLVVPLWFFGQASPGDSKRIRPVDPTEALTAFAQQTRAPVPSTPDGWVVNVARFDAGVVRIGYVRGVGGDVRGDSYAEFSGGAGPTFLETAAGKGATAGTVDVAGVAWDRYLSTDGHESLLRHVGATTVLVGGIRETATSDQLRALAATVH